MLWDSRLTYLHWQILVVFINVWVLWIDVQVKLEACAHSVIFGSISLLRLKVFSFPSTLWSLLWICTTFRGWFSCFHSTLSLSGKKPWMLQTSLIGDFPNSPCQTGCNVIFGETTRCPEIWGRDLHRYFPQAVRCTCFKNMSGLHPFSRTYLKILVR